MIIFEKEVIEYLDDLVYELYINEYFGFIETAEIFVSKLVDFINENIKSIPHRETPFKINHLGLNYIFYTSSQRTTWYIFFEKQENNYLITNIINNHSKEAKWLF